jgi:hypothetical protein
MKTPPPPPRGEGISSSLFASPLEKALEEGLSDLLWDLTTHEDKAPPFSEDYFLQRKRFDIVLFDVARTSDRYERAYVLLLRLLEILNNPNDPLWRFGYPHPLKFPQ